MSDSLPPVRAPEIAQPGVTWFNTPSPLSLADLAGRLVILDFWTFCCINCIQILPSLRRVEEAFPDEVTVIGVHSPKFAAERDAANVAQAIARYDIRHPVAHDPDFSIWRAYAVRAWPTLVFVAPDGRVVGQQSGEPNPETLIQAVGDVLEAYRADGTLRPGILPSTQVTVEAGGLKFPGKIKALPNPGGAKLWAVADSGHHQIAVLDDGGVELLRYGSGEAGFEDGIPRAAQFNSPQGLIADESAIYVADTGNHAIRRIDRASGHVATLAGTGMRGHGLTETAAIQTVELASPWDLELRGNFLIFANAGSHQLGVIDLDEATVSPLAGSLREDITDGPAQNADLAQPSGLALDTDKSRLFFADSETSSIRCLDLGDGHVKTLVGAGLFEFGHVNGAWDEARLQHCLGLTWFDDGPAGSILVADSYNGTIRVLDLAEETARDFDDGFHCEDDVCLPLAEPAGIVSDGPDRILVSDTNNHRILEYDLVTQRYRTWSK